MVSTIARMFRKGLVLWRWVSMYFLGKQRECISMRSTQDESATIFILQSGHRIAAVKVQYRIKDAQGSLVWESYIAVKLYLRWKLYIWTL